MLIQATGSVQDVPLFAKYSRHNTAWDELFDQTGQPHRHCGPLVDSLGQLLTSEFQGRRGSADLVFINQGITFSVYADRRGVEKIFPFDLIPRPVAAAEWARLEARSAAANPGPQPVPLRCLPRAADPA